MKRSEYIELQRDAAVLAQRVFPFIKLGQIEIAGFGLDDGVHLLGLINLFNETFCGKLLISLPGWICPPHHHLSATNKKDEGFYVVFGTLVVTAPRDKVYRINPGETLYLPAGTIHQLSAEGEGAVYFEFSEKDTRTDIFVGTGRKITRDPPIEEDVAGFTPPAGGFPVLGSVGVRLTPHVALQVGVP